MARFIDFDLIELKERLGPEEYSILYRNIYQKTKCHGEKRFSGKRYKNSKEKLSRLKEKYKNGVPDEAINEMLGIKNG
jgi:hypothetical protein